MLVEMCAFPLAFAVVAGFGAWWVGEKQSSSKITKFGKGTVAGSIIVAFILGLIDNDALTPMLESLRR